jgi:pyridoxamine 5'-phosphate oxidase
MEKIDLTNLRREYIERGLSEADLLPDPIAQFQQWFQLAQQAELVEPNAMTLATADASGKVTARTVLLKIYDPQGFVFFTNYESTKAQQIAENTQVALLFAWLPLERQVSITGRAEKISLAESFAYFVKRPRASQIGAWVSAQSTVISSRLWLEQQFDAMKQKWADGEVPLPPFWGGYRVRPQTIEFWQGSAKRLHDRFLYTRTLDERWTRVRLSA